MTPNGLIYQPLTDFSGQVTITMVSNDLGHTGTGHIQSDTDTVAVTVTGTQNGWPWINAPGPQLYAGGRSNNLHPQCHHDRGFGCGHVGYVGQIVGGSWHNFSKRDLGALIYFRRWLE